MNNNKFNQISIDLKKNLKKIGIKKNDTVYLGIDLGKTFKSYKELLFNSDKLSDVKKNCSDIVLTCLKECVGSNGTIICPSFSFNFIKSKIFNLKKTRSDLGYFENYFLNQKDIVRSLHPIYSLCVWGKKKKIVEPCGKFSFGENSPFSNFLKFNVKFLNIGIKWIETCTYLHHLEHLNGLNHRFYKPTTGKIIHKNRHFIETYYNPVRYTGLSSKKAEYKIEKHLKNNFFLKEVKKKIYCSSLETKDIHNLGMKILKKEPSYFMTKKINVFINLKDKLKIKEDIK
jgi:aminoglycoside 3-N-acetyltransferase